MSQFPSMYESVQQFYDVTGQPRPVIPSQINAQRRNTLMAYIMSEVLEFGAAATLEDQLDAAVDLLYFVMDVFVELGINPDIPFSIVHATNMAKLWPDGKARFDHSVVPPRMLKPDGWTSPTHDLHDYINDMIRALRAINVVESIKETR